MRTFLTFILIVAAIAGAFALYFYATTPNETALVRFPLSPADREAIASVPASATAFTYIPRAGALENQLRRNPILSNAIATWTADRPLPRGWMLGSGALVAWQRGKETRYLLRLEPVRATVVRIYLMALGDTGGSILINAPAEQSIGPTELAAIEQLAARLPPGNALVVQRVSGRSAFPPIARPTVSSIAVTDTTIDITSRAVATSSSDRPFTSRLARGAILSASFASAPRMLEDLNRLFGTKISGLFADGATIALYDIDTGKLLPRPLGVIVVPNTPERRAMVGSLEKVGVRVVEKSDELVISFDRTIDAYLKDATDVTTPAGGRWTLRMDAERMAPLLNRLGDSVGLRIASPRLFRAARDLSRWIGSLQQAKTIEATDTSDGAQDELKVRISSK